MIPHIFTAYDPPPKVVQDDWPESLTRQSEADGCDINKIVSRYKATGMLPLGSDTGFYADVSEMGDYREAMERVRTADDMFIQLPSATRAQFANDPALFLDFVTDPENNDQLIEMGLVRKEVETPAPQEVPAEPQEGS